MTQRERFLSVFRGEQPDRFPWVADLVYWWMANGHGETPEESFGDTDGFLQLHRDCGVVAYFLYRGNVFKAQCEGVETETLKDGGETVIITHTPAGDLVQRQRFLEESCCTAITQHPVGSVADLRIVRWLAEHTEYQENFEAWCDLDRKIGDDGVAVVLIPRMPLMRLMAEYAGVPNLSYLFFDERECLDKTVQALDESYDAIFEIIARSDAFVVHFGDNLSAENVGTYFDAYFRDYYTRRLRQLHDAGKKCVVHVDGTMRGLVDRLAALGFDGIESMTPLPSGDTEIEELREITRSDDIMLWGGLPGAIFAPPFTTEDVEAYLRRLIRAHGPSGKLIVGSADQIPPNGNLDAVKRVAEVLAEKEMTPSHVAS